MFHPFCYLAYIGLPLIDISDLLISSEIDSALRGETLRQRTTCGCTSDVNPREL